MANVKISQLAPASALTGAEEIPVVQGGATKKTTAQAIADLGGGGSVEIVADGSIGGPFSTSCSVVLAIPTDTVGTVQAPILILPNIAISSGGGYGGGAFTATTLSFPTLEIAGDFQITGTTTLKHLSADSLISIGSNNNLSLYSNSALETISFPVLESAGYLNLGSTPNLVTISFPSLTTVNQIGVNGSGGLVGYTASMFPVLTKASTINWGYYYFPSFTVDIPTLQTLNSLQGGQSFGSLVVNLPGIVSYTNYYTSINNINSLSQFIVGTVGVTKKWGDGNSNPYIQIQNCALSQASVDNILTVLASLDGTNGTTISSYGNLYLYGGSSAAPSSTGLAAKAVLQSRGWYITTN